MPCDVDGCNNPDVGLIHGEGNRCVDCMLYDLNHDNYTGDGE